VCDNVECYTVCKTGKLRVITKPRGEKNRKGLPEKVIFEQGLGLQQRPTRVLCAKGNIQIKGF
jgi:hypothetical protein